MRELPDMNEYLKRIEKLELDIAKIKKFRSSEKYKKYIKKIDKVQLDYLNLRSLFIYDFLAFFNLKHQDYATFKLLFYVYPEYEDIYFHVNSLLDDLLKSTLKDDNIQNIYEAISKVKDLPSIEQIVDEVNIRIKKDPIGKFTKNIIKPINKRIIIQILYLYNKDFNFDKRDIKYLAYKILQINGISFEAPSIV